MYDKPLQPLDDLETLRSDVRKLYSMLTEEAAVVEQLRTEKQQLREALRNVVNLLEMQAPSGEYREQTLKQALQVLYPEQKTQDDLFLEPDPTLD